ncbi:hypothetical protein NFI96_002199 [Prochilodus magdalenae]|nr:hypothetical protein NFI96_002199 [Prochilodus magdalenae]
MNREVRLLLKARDAAYRSGDQEAYSLARANLRRGISKAKHCYKQRIEEHFNSSDPRRMWQGIRTITDYKPLSTAPHTNGASLSDELNHFYARFDRGNKVIFSKMDLPPGEQPLTLSTKDVCHTLRRVSARKAAGPGEVPGRVLKACAEQLAVVFTDIFNLSLAQAVVPTVFKTATIVPVPKHSTASTLNDFRPVALTPIISKCFERLVSSHVKSCLPAALDLHQFAYRRNRSTEDAITAALHTVLSHLDCQNSYVRMLFINFSSAFNTVIPSKLIYKLSQLGISTSLCNWILDVLTDRPQSVKLDKLFSSTITLNTGVPQGCILSPLLYSLFTYDCVPVYGSNSIIKFEDDTTVIGLIRGDDETAYRDEVQHLAVWCDDNNLVLNTQKTKEVIVDFRKSRNQAHTPIHISGAEVECVSNFKFLGVHISEDLTWSLNSSTMVKKAQQRLYFLRSLKKAHLCPRILVDFYRCTIESTLTNCISVWYGSCSASDRKALQQVVKTAQRITGTQLPTIESVYKKRCLSRARSIIKDPSHPNHELFTLLPSGRCYRSLRSRTNRLRKSFFPEAVTLLNSTPSPSSRRALRGKWIVSPEFVLDSVKHQAWLSEASYELNLCANLKAPVITNPLQKWREKVARGIMSGAFQGWLVCLEIEDSGRRNMFERILKAGKAVVYTDKSASRAVTHVFTKDGSKVSQNARTTYHTLSYIAYHLFGSLWSSLNWAVHVEQPKQQEKCMQLESTGLSSLIIRDKSVDAKKDNLLLFELEENLKDYIMKMELRRRKLLKVPELFSYYTPIFPTQVAAVDFSNVRSLVECGLFPQALEEVQGSLHPGVLPPASILHACMQHALHGEAQAHFLSMFSTVLNDILCNNPTWSSPGSVKYFLQILQCPQCKNGAWPLLQTSVRTATCHSLPSPAPPELLRFHGNLQAFFLRLFQLELHAASTRGKGSQKSVLYSMFWNVWEKSTLSSRALQQLVELLVEAVLWGLHSTQEWNGRLLATLQEILAVVVEYWAQEHSQLNSRLVDKGFQDLAEYIAILCQDLHPDTLKELIPALASPRLRMLTADAIYKNICSRNGLFIPPQPLTLHKIVSSYLKALGQLCGRTPMYADDRGAERSISAGSDSQVSNLGEKERVGGSGSGKENVPRGLHRVNPAGETLLHRACKRNQVETVLHILSLPGTDVNVKDHAGWTPLHEACNHGASECVAALLQHCPGLQLDSQVKGVSPLHDALLNQHTDIAKMLLRHAG